METEVRPSALALTVLGLLAAGPLHPYAMQRLIREWGKDQVINVGQRANLYRTIRRLHVAGLVAVLQTERNENFPERTVYELTNSGRDKLREWLETMLATPRNEFPEFPAALSFIMLLTPEQVLPALERRAAVLNERLKDLEADLGAEAGPHRLFLLETEYLRDVKVAELRWAEALIEDLRGGALSWSEKDLGLAKAGASYRQSMASEAAADLAARIGRSAERSTEPD
jgi:DNA-binding PadR family transcriptional regulator